MQQIYQGKKSGAKIIFLKNTFEWNWTDNGKAHDLDVFKIS